MRTTVITLAVVVATQTYAGGFSTSFGGTGSRGGVSASSLRPPRVGWYGDSLTQGACSPDSPPVVLDGLLPGGEAGGYVVSNLGVSGETAHEIYERVASGSATACNSQPCGYYIVQGGVNTLKGPQYAEAVAELVASIALDGDGVCDTEEPNTCGTLDSIDYLHANQPAARIFAIGVTPYASCDPAVCPSLVDPGPRALAYNAALLSACEARPWLTCILPYDDFRDTPTTHNLRADYACDDDGIHYEQAGSNAIAQDVYGSAVWP